MTQNDWNSELARLHAPGGILWVQLPCEVLMLAKDGQICPSACDALARWCLGKTGLEPLGITAPSWGCAYRMRGGDEKAHFSYWQLDEDSVGIYITDPDLDGRHVSERGRWDRLYVIPDMPIPEGYEDCKGTREERRAWLKAGRPRRQLLDALALVHLARFLLVKS